MLISQFGMLYIATIPDRLPLLTVYPMTVCKDKATEIHVSDVLETWTKTYKTRPEGSSKLKSASNTVDHVPSGKHFFFLNQVSLATLTQGNIVSWSQK